MVLQISPPYKTHVFRARIASLSHLTITLKKDGVYSSDAHANLVAQIEQDLHERWNCSYQATIIE
jgi:hypothetical protein